MSKAFAIVCQVSVYIEWKSTPISQIDADIDLLKCFELPHASADCSFPQAAGDQTVVLKKQAADGQVVAFCTLCKRKNKVVKGFRVTAREGIFRIRDEVCFIVNLTARSK